MVAKVEVAIACNIVQSPLWWGPLMSRLISEQKSGEIEILSITTHQSALPDNAKNIIVGWAKEQKQRDDLTDVNRNKAVQKFMDGKADWLMWIDDDTLPPKGFLTHLLGLGRDFIGGLYFLGNEPYNPIAYMRDAYGMYKSYYNYSKGALVQVDSIGMGCTLIHRSVYKKIMEGHQVFMRPDGSLVPIDKRALHQDEFDVREYGDVFVSGNFMHIRLVPLLENDDRGWPFYALEYARTEDHYFCELAEHVGIKPWLDTLVECDHYKVGAINRKTYMEHKEKMESTNVK